MRLIAFSDTHGNLASADRIFALNPACDHFFFLGDGLDELEVIKAKYPDKKIYSVLGNCDKPGTAPAAAIVELFRTKIYMTHGHLCSVRDSTEQLIANAKKEGATIILFGHTHCRYLEQENGGLLILNPGSAAQPKDHLPPAYAFIDITPCGISCVHVDLT